MRPDVRHGVVFVVQASAPPGPPRFKSFRQRKMFWEDGQRLPEGGLITLATKDGGHSAVISTAVIVTSKSVPRVYLNSDPGGVLCDGNFISFPVFHFSISFLAQADTLRAARALQGASDDSQVISVAFECPVLYESVRPFLEALKAVDPISMPMSKYIRQTDLRGQSIALPAYARNPNFTWNLKVLLKEHTLDSCFMNPRNPSSVANARGVLYKHGKLDRT
jgi:hypothetical protein